MHVESHAWQSALPCTCVRSLCQEVGVRAGGNDGFIGRVEQPTSQRVQGFQVQRLPGSAFSLVNSAAQKSQLSWDSSPLRGLITFHK